MFACVSFTCLCLCVLYAGTRLLPSATRSTGAGVSVTSLLSEYRSFISIFCTDQTQPLMCAVTSIEFLLLLQAICQFLCFLLLNLCGSTT